ncbi:MAG: phosphate ABC transporter permease subunit PstC [Pseudomonadota bacterium]
MLHQFGYLPSGWLIFAVIAVSGFFAFVAGRGRAMAFDTSAAFAVNSRPNYHGYFLAMSTVAPAAIVLLGQTLFSETLVRSLLAGDLPSGFADLGAAARAQYIDRIAEAADLGAGVAARLGEQDTLFAAVVDRFVTLKGGVNLGALLLALGSAAGGFLWARRQLAAPFRARQKVEGGIQWLLFLCAAIAIATTAGIVLSLFIESLRFFAVQPFWTFLFGLEWNPQGDAEFASFGAIPLFFGTFVIAFIAMCVAAPIGLYAAIYLSEYASHRVRSIAKPLLEVLAGIPTVVYGFFALLVVAPAVRAGAVWINGLPFVPDEFLAASSSNALAAGLVMGVMIVPFVSSLSDDVINAVPQSLRDAALAMGATPSETIKDVVMPAALPGVIAALLLGVSRAIGETMIVVMAAGQRPAMTLDPTSEITTITVQIVALLTGDSEFDSPKTLSAFALGFVLFAVTLIFNLIALRVVQRYRERYD